MEARAQESWIDTALGMARLKGGGQGCDFRTGTAMPRSEALDQQPRKICHMWGMWITATDQTVQTARPISRNNRVRERFEAVMRNVSRSTQNRLLKA